VARSWRAPGYLSDVAGVIRLPLKPVPLPPPHPVYDLDAGTVKLRGQRKLAPVLARAANLVRAGKRVVLRRGW
jgi:hypothetical protein